MVMYSISAKLISPFSTIGKATADKITAELGKRVGKNSRFRFRVCGILNIVVLLDKFICLILNENLLLLKFRSRFFHLVAFIWELRF